MNQPWSTPISRRQALWGGATGLGTALLGGGCVGVSRQRIRVGPFAADITVPLNHGMMGGSWLSKSVADPLEAHGVVFLGSGFPVVFVSLDWCELRNDAYERWQSVLAAAAGTAPERVMISTVHQHDAPVADLAAERILRERKLIGTICDLEFHEVVVQRVAAALEAAIRSAQPVTHLGLGQAQVVGIASNRRYRMPDGAIRFDRMSSTRNAFAVEAEEGLIDPWLKTLSFWRGEVPVVALSFYAVHPMSYYGQGEISADFPGLARRKRQRDTPGLAQIYVSGCSGNITAGKYNTGARETRPILADRLVTAMSTAWSVTQRVPLQQFRYRVEPLKLEVRSSPGFTERDLLARLNSQTPRFQQCLAALGLSWRRRVATGRPIQVPCLDFGSAALVLLPGEAYIEYQLAAQALRTDSFICTAGYGDGATGYIPTDGHWAENDSNLADWCWVAPGAEARVRAVLARVLRRS